MLKAAFFTLVSLPVYACLYLETAILVLTAYILGLFGWKKAVRILTLLWTRLVLWILMQNIKVYGKENIVTNRRVMILANHSSGFDINAIMSIFPDISWFGREKLLKIPVFGQFLRMLNYIPMKDAGYKNTKNMISQLVEKSTVLNIAIFPEGTRTLNGNLSRFHKGFVHILRQTDIDILPVTLNGFFQLKPKTRFYIDFSSRVSVTVHPLIPKASLTDKTDDEIILLVRNTILSAYEAGEIPLSTLTTDKQKVESNLQTDYNQ